MKLSLILYELPGSPCTSNRFKPYPAVDIPEYEVLRWCGAQCRDLLSFFPALPDSFRIPSPFADQEEGSCRVPDHVPEEALCSHLEAEQAGITKDAGGKHCPYGSFPSMRAKRVKSWVPVKSPAAAAMASRSRPCLPK